MTRARRALWLGAGVLLTSLAIIGALVPVMPSTVFALGAAACFGRSSPQLEAWVLAHPTLGPRVIAWRAHGVVPPRAKVAAVVSMLLSATIVALTAPFAIAAGTAATLLLVGTWLVSRPSEPPRLA